MSEKEPLDSGDDLWCSIAAAAPHRAAAIRMACVLEATAPKVGNVHPAAHFHDLNFSHFVTAADAVAEVLGNLDGGRRLGSAIHAAVTSSVVATGTNVNLGIVLLLGPLVASELMMDQDHDMPRDRQWSAWQSRAADVLERLDHRQGAKIAAAIAGASAGGLADESLGDDHPLDVTRNIAEEYDIVAAMRLAASRDRIALQYADGFRDLFQHVVPTLHHWVAKTGDLLTGIVWTHVALIAEAGDSLIARKSGQAESDRVAGLAAACLAASEQVHGRHAIASIRNLDAALRFDGNRLNPGTTADLIAAALYILLRTTPRLWAKAPRSL